jgi:Ni,Fe-hydrogenase III large subunit/Ni,Fe-hydrogenase III component G
MMHMCSDTTRKEPVPLPANLPATLQCVSRDEWLANAQQLRQTGAELLTLWGADDRSRDGCFHIYAAYLTVDEVLAVRYAPEMTNLTYPDLGGVFPAARRMQRAVFDLLGIAAYPRDERGWLQHGGWPEKVFPLRRDVDGKQEFPLTSAPYRFVSVAGDGVHEIPVGPVHAGTIEPGHFRFSVVGEKILRLEERLGYTHKGVAKRFEQLVQHEGHRLAARLSGDAAVAFSWAYCTALESITRVACPPRAVALRALALELERIANHLGDLGALGNDAGFAFGQTQFSRLKEDLLRANSTAFGARYLLDYVIPGGVAADVSVSAQRLLLDQCNTLQQVVPKLRTIYDEHAGLQDRFRETGRLEHDLAIELGATGLAARASGIARDLRVNYPWLPYSQLKPRAAVQSYGDVFARVQVRFDETLESLRLCSVLLQELPPGSIQTVVPTAEANCLGVGLIESWRGPVLIALETGAGGSIRRCHAHDPSWQNWPLLEYAVMGNIVPDFPLINKSFNLSYSGHDG